MSKIVRSLNIFLLLFALFCPSALAIDNSLYADLLDSYVKNGSVDYLGFKNDEAQLDRYLALIDKTDPDTLSRNDQLAFYLNAYNAYTIKLILNNFKNGKPLPSIRKIGGFFSKPWGIKFCKVGGKILTLDNIEHDIIRPTFKDARIHFAANCASKSCPPLISSPYEGVTIDQQLNNNVRAYLHDKQQNYFKNNTLYASKIFDWYAEDFPATTEFFKQYAEGELKEALTAAQNVQVKYLDYDWSLNGM